MSENICTRTLQQQKKQKNTITETHLAQFLAFVMRQQRSQTLKARIDTLHASAFVTIGDLTSHALLVVHGAATAAAIATIAITITAITTIAAIATIGTAFAATAIVAASAAILLTAETLIEMKNTLKNYDVINRTEAP